MLHFFQTRSGAATLSVASNSVLIALKITVGLFTGSISVISEAIHSSTDLLAAVIAFFAIRSAARPADADHQYGHAKYESLAAGIEAVLIFAAAAFIVYEAAQRLARGTTIENLDWAIAVMAISAGANFFVSRHLFNVAKRTKSPALAADAWHLTTDIYTALGVMVGLILVRVTGLRALDPIVAMAVALFIVKAAWDITRGSMADLLDESLPASDEAKIRAILDAHKGLYSNVRAMRTRRAGGARHAYIALQFRPEVSLPDAHALTEHLENEIRAAFPGASVVIEAEAPSMPAATSQSIIEQVQNVARRLGAAVHHITAYTMGDRFNVNLHLEVDGGLSLTQAHAQATRLEDELRREVPRLARVVTHIEPAAPASSSDDAQARDEALVERELAAIARQLPENLPRVRSIHDVDVRRNDGNLSVSLHCTLDGAVPIGEAHRLSGEIEAQLKRDLPQVSNVFIHTEPQE